MILTIIFSLIIFGHNVSGGSISDSIKYLNVGETTDAIIEFKPVINEVLELLGSLVSSLLEGDTRRNFIIKLLKERTALAQLPVLNVLKTLRVFSKSKTFWVVNRIVLKDATPETLETISQVPGSFVIREPKTVHLIEPVQISPKFQEKTLKSSDYQWGVTKIGAPKLHEKGINGTGEIVCIIDTGVNANHEALKSNYKGDDASWFDAYGVHKTPFDVQSHGTHCIGIAVGTKNGIGVAPGAKWIACKGIKDDATATEESLVDCGQWAACPGLDSMDNCYGFPSVVTGSWGLWPNDTFFNEVIDTWNALEIVPVFAIGNVGPNCSTGSSPGNQANVISVGATDINDTIADFSSRGPALNGSNMIKPEISAPGVNVLSANAADIGGYIVYSGTSMASPHVAGAVALLLQAHPTISFKDISSTLFKTAEKTGLNFTGLESCSTSDSKTFPNNIFGSGILNIYDAVTQIETDDSGLLTSVIGFLGKNDSEVVT